MTTIRIDHGTLCEPERNTRTVRMVYLGSYPDEKPWVVVDWCAKAFGPEGTCWWYDHDSYRLIMDDKFYTLFQLRWL